MTKQISGLCDTCSGYEWLTQHFVDDREFWTCDQCGETPPPPPRIRVVSVTVTVVVEGMTEQQALDHVAKMSLNDMLDRGAWASEPTID
jgi:hypothetical protein